MVRPIGRRGDDDLSPVTDKTGRVEGRTVTGSSRGVRGRHSTSDLPATPTHLALGFHHGTGKPGSSTQLLTIPFRSQPPLQPHLSHTPVPYEPYGSAQSSSHPTDTVYDLYLHAPTIRPHIPYRSITQELILEFIDQPRQIGAKSFYQIFGAAPQDSSCSTHGYSHAKNDVSSSIPYVPRPTARDHGSLKFRSHYMALIDCELIDAHVRPLASRRGYIYLFDVCTPVYSCPPYPTSGGLQAAKQQDVRVEEYFCGGTMARSTFALIDRDLDKCSGHSAEFLHR
ncbi:hypothetical protein M9H77_02093 [Catharanthus roseus]|uniref:Uncharacterized protein n=1 Tax=Catharanthus roseus TaxID=4058 RepID=A0ACC0C7G0_CATRO|nr:hypothetical protein M9H77_02093 [Catharanthus roseus]